MTPLDHYERFTLNSKNARTADRYVRTLRQLEETIGKSPEQITEADFYAFLDAKRKCKENTKNLYKVHFRDFLKFCDKRDIKTACRAIYIEMKRTSNDSHAPLLGEDKQTLLKNLSTETDFLALRDTLLIRLLIDTGARVSEITDLCIDALEEGRAYIKTKKTTTSRYILWKPETERLLRRYLDARAMFLVEGDPLFIGIGQGRISRLTPRSVERIFKRECKKAGLTGYVPHSCRHGRAIEMRTLENRSLEEIRRMLGHTTILSVQTYLQESDESFYERMQPAPRMTIRQMFSKTL